MQTFFQNKILKIRELFKGTKQYEPTTDSSVPLLRKFAPMTEKQISLIIKQMKSKTCELDDIPTSILKKILPVVCPLITKIVNTSLTNGEFSTKWKTAVVRPLLKKIGLEFNKAELQTGQQPGIHLQNCGKGHAITTKSALSGF